MTVLDRVLFNMVFNAALSFLTGLLIVLLCLTLFPASWLRLRLYFLSLPFIKVVVDMLPGVPADSSLWSDLNFWALPSDKGGWLSASAGLSEFGPMLALRLGIGDKAQTELSQSLLYSISLPDLAYSWLNLHMGRFAVAGILAIVLLVSLLLLGRRFAIWRRFERSRAWDRRSAGQHLETRQLGWRQVDIYLSKHFGGSPFAGGIWRPYICFPQEAYEKLGDAERRAVIAHEMAHIRHFDLLQTMAITVLGDIFWFTPCYHLLVHKLSVTREMVADMVSLRWGGEPLCLAQALLKLSAIHDGHATANFFAKPPLRQRVEALLQGARPERGMSGGRYVVVFVLIALVTATVFRSTCVGNYQIPHDAYPLAEALRHLGQRLLDTL